MLGAGTKLDDDAIVEENIQEGEEGKKVKKIKEDHFEFVWDFYWKGCKTKLYELKEDLLFIVYPAIFGLENGGIKIQIRDSLKNKINDFNNLEGYFDDCEFNKNNNEEVYSSLKNNLELLLNNSIDELLSNIKKTATTGDNEKKYLIIPEFFRNKFDELLISFKEAEPIY